MLSNCSIKLETAHEISYFFKGDSMLDYTKYSLLSGDLLKCNNNDLFHNLFDGSFKPSDTDVFVFNLFRGQLFTSKVMDIDLDKEMIT